jgi:CRISPR-associated protein Cas1
MTVPKDLHELPKFRDGLSYVYLDRCRIEQDGKSIACFDLDGVVKIPCAALALIMLGPGASITHEAVKTIVQNGCNLMWVGEDGVRFYAQGIGETRSSYRLIKQASLASDPIKRLDVVKKMYAMRFDDPDGMSEMSLEELRGMEGVRVRSSYARASKDFGVEWNGRNYMRASWGSADPVNRALSTANSCLYGISHAAIVTAGYSPGIGFIHSGKQLSFVYDIADLYKASTTIPAAFKATAEGVDDLEKRVRHHLRDQFRKEKLLARIVDDINTLMEIPKEEISEEMFIADEAAPAPLWGESEKSLEKRMRHASDDP